MSGFGLIRSNRIIKLNPLTIARGNISSIKVQEIFSKMNLGMQVIIASAC